MTGRRENSGAGSLPAVAVELLESLYQHRLLSTGQLHALHTPHASRRWTQALLSQLERHDLARFVRHAGAAKLWFCTECGADAVERLTTRVEARRKVTTPEQAAGPLRHHTLAVNDVGLAFVRAARERGDQCGPLAWRHEVAHPIGRPPASRRTELVVADALLTYLRVDDQEAVVEYRFLELDRATLPVEELAAQLARYARLHRFAADDDIEPAWRHHYPTFPGVVAILAGRKRSRLERRLTHVVGLCQTDPTLTDNRDVSIAFCLLSDLAGRGPFAQIFLDPARPDQLLNWLGQPAATSARHQGARS